MRKVTVHAERAVYRARVEAGAPWFRRGPHWRYVVEKRWSQIPTGMVEEEHWRPHKTGPWVTSSDDAASQASAWLDAAEGRNPRDGDFL